MSSRNVELIRNGWEHFNRTGEIDPELLDPDVQWGTFIETYQGVEGVRRWIETLNESFDDLRVDLEELTDVADQVVSVSAMRGRARVTGIEGELRFAILWTFRAGKVVRVDSFETKDAAMAAARG